MPHELINEPASALHAEGELLPWQDAQQAAKQIAEWKVLRTAWRERDAGPDREDEIDR